MERIWNSVIEGSLSEELVGEGSMGGAAVEIPFAAACAAGEHLRSFDSGTAPLRGPIPPLRMTRKVYS